MICHPNAVAVVLIRYRLANVDASWYELKGILYEKKAHHRADGAPFIANGTVFH